MERPCQSRSIPHAVPPMHIRILMANQTSYLASQASEVRFNISDNVTAVFGVTPEVVGNNYAGTPGVNTQLYDITQCHTTITPTQLRARRPVRT